MAKHSFLILHPKDDLAVALVNLEKGQVIEHGDQSITLLTDVQLKHKFALCDFPKDSIMTQYGVPVGRALCHIKAGEAITTQNTEHSSDDMCNWMPGYQEPPTDASKFQGQTFKGFHRNDGQVGTRNNWLVIPLVFCENNNLMTLREVFNRELGFTDHSSYQDELRKLTELYKNGASVDDILNSAESSTSHPQSSNNLFPNVDGLKFLFHNMGCGGTNEDSQVLAKLLAGYIKHPNTAGATILSLGCQKTQMGLLESYMEQLNVGDKPIYFHEQQKIGTEQELISAAIKSTFAGLIQANENKRQDAPLSKLVIGVECGASDGFSGISSNPAIGQVSDLIVKLGGAAVLSEFPELFGVEKEMIMRCKDENTANTFIDLMRRYEARAEADGTSMSTNPSPGNIKDGLITDAMKSAGAAKKGGTAIIQDVQDYPGYINKTGLNLLNTPGNDVESCTALAGAGCNLILFSTGLGTPTGNPVTPVIKVSSNSTVAQKMPDIIDFDTGCIISGDKSLEETGQNLLEHCIAVASGTTLSKSEQLGQDDFIPWKRGTSL
ncbi:altronate dehydratase family protein [Lentisphaera marina]|uniref:UxaA family hydrolase n=1 Tax=Lentisphaera marina TaxID=1111041 RepID=UPI0023669D28|nr:altronate dehydratase family protein [Lentisphaera marina]MDD7986395.1 altronate dehydratase family protein [Lentisphaera marina]